MTPDPSVVAALDECLKYARTLEDCHGLNAAYFGRLRFHRLEPDFVELGKKARRRKEELLDRIFELDATPGVDRYTVEFHPLESPEDIDKVYRYFNDLYEESRAALENGRADCKAAGDSVSSGLLKRHKEAIEGELARIEAKQARVRLVGPVEYLSHHMHPEN